MLELPKNYQNLNKALLACAKHSGHPVQLLAVSKTQPVEAIRACYQLGQRAFGHRPRVGDSFCGGGSIPFEAARIGCDAYGSDLNPVAGLLTSAVDRRSRLGWPPLSV